MPAVFIARMRAPAHCTMALWCAVAALILADAAAESGTVAGGATGDTRPAQSEAGRVVSVRPAPHCPEPLPGLLPAGYINKGDTCLVETTLVDSSGGAWFLLHTGTTRVWSPAVNWRYVGAVTDEISASRGVNDDDRKRRLRILQQHREWPRRIIAAVREGKICLDMSGEQLVASWGEPSQKSPAFAVGLGVHEAWFYAGTGSDAAVVLLIDGRVIGWSMESKK
jgi:hypothetical protein